MLKFEGDQEDILIYKKICPPTSVNETMDLGNQIKPTYFHFANLVKLLKPEACQWKQIGTFLRIRNYKLQAIDDEGSRLAPKLTRVLLEWVQMEGACVETLQTALKQSQ
ncbi:hypothetical protein D5018_17795 [Parashewanella curva]|uniref:Death domain-containing protein n=1 Tax=Parashewanella curva TaxID=2338552 RepID=A0A3L8PUS9_9GAMM|nr:hypothetical protein [Parashewanella curva]RLV58333.1 hypothetical protein D5018_17795 [Parashewanella curva]